ncbi:MAG: L,D-transpeptidase family protein [Planctomycetaceae bacterium]|nr:L,D-transpeptidase family protein [Planctomycetaceae bacterium]
MEPFVTVTERTKSRLPWILCGVFAAVFLVWHFNLIPAIKSVSTGSVTANPESAEKATNSSDVASLSEVLDQIIDAREQGEGAQNSAPADLERDEILRAIAFDDEPPQPGDEQTSGFSTGAQEESSHSRSGIEQASFKQSSREGAPSGERVPGGKDLNANPPEVLTAALAAKLRNIDQFLTEDRVLDAHAALSEIYWQQPQARAVIADRLTRTAFEIYASPDHHVLPVHVVEFGETLAGIADEYQVPWQYLARLNRTTPRTLQAGQRLKVVRGPFSAVVDLSDYSMTIHADGWFVHRYLVGIGQDGKTPVGHFTVQDRIENPTWHNPDGGIVDADDPANPLGEYWLGLGNHIGIHGTIDPESIGRSASRGCIHLADGDIEEVFQLLNVGSEVLILKSDRNVNRP